MKYVRNTLTAALMLLCLVAARTAEGQEKVIHSFNGTDGSGPLGGLLLDVKGNLFGTTFGDGPGYYGSVFELSPVSGGGWNEKLLYGFTGGADGAFPVGPLISDGKGNLYGTLEGGGSGPQGPISDVAGIFELSQAVDGSWVEKLIYNFGAAYEGSLNPGLVLDAYGNLYGTSGQGGIVAGAYASCEGGCGIVYQLAPSAGGTWTEKIIHNFGMVENDGLYAQAGLTIDSSGNLYGTTVYGGASSSGAAYELTRRNDGSWSETILHSFGSSGNDGAYPESSLVLDREGNLYGTTASGGTDNGGTIFELSPSRGGAWTEEIFTLGIANEGYGFSNLAIDPLGDLYGTSGFGGSSGQGTVFELARNLDRTRTETILHNFVGSADDGSEPTGSVTFDKHGNLYGTTYMGGATGNGAIFEIETAARGVPTMTTVSAPFPSSTSSPLVAGEPIELQVTVAPTGGVAVPTGTVTFADPAGGSVTVPVIDGKATYYGKVPPVGTYSVYASYSGGSGSLPSQSAIITAPVVAH